MLLKIGCKDIIKKYVGQIEIKKKINYIRYYVFHQENYLLLPHQIRIGEIIKIKYLLMMIINYEDRQ